VFFLLKLFFFIIKTLEKKLKKFDYSSPSPGFSASNGTDDGSASGSLAGNHEGRNSAASGFN
jgi:hypothetical protein